MPTPYDGLYKQLFSHPPMVESLLRGFIHEEWVDHVDFATLEKPNSHYISEALQQRSDDIIWRVRLNLPDGQKEWLYLYLLIEFQSRDEPWMALRVLTYVCLLYQDLIKARQIKPGDKLPPVFPLVLYNGQPRWQASQEIADLIAAPASLKRWRPSFRYHLLDEGRVPAEKLHQLSDNLLSLLIQLETSAPDPHALREATRALASHLKDPAYDSLRRAFVVFFNRAVFRKLNPRQTVEEFKDLQEIDAMLAERIDEWGMQLRQEGETAAARRLLSRQLRLRFGPLPPWAEQQLEQAELAQLENWSDAVLTAESLPDIFRQGDPT